MGEEPHEVPKDLPRHVAVVMDGNGRWARRRGLPRIEGHKIGAESARVISECCAEWSIPYLTLYAFSTENWARPQAEVAFLMRELLRFLKEQRSELVEKDIRLKGIGRTQGLPAGVQEELARAEEATRNGSRLTLQLAINYGGRAELVDACKALARRVQREGLSVDNIDEQALSQELYTAGVPDPDLVIRTAGELRVSNFMLWQISYAELYVADVLWPDFRREELLEALRSYAGRRRRFGRVDEPAPAEGPSARDPAA